MKKLETSQTETGSLKGIVDQILALVDVERVYVHKHEKEEICHTVLTILITNTCTKSPAKLLSLVNILFTHRQTLLPVSWSSMNLLRIKPMVVRNISN